LGLCCSGGARGSWTSSRLLLPFFLHGSGRGKAAVSFLLQEPVFLLQFRLRKQSYSWAVESMLMLCKEVIRDSDLMICSHLSFFALFSPSYL